MSLPETPIRWLRASRFSRISGTVVMAASIVCATVPQATALDAPSGPTILTIVGDITETNRSSFDEADLAAQDWLLAIEKNGEDLGIGRRGPVWLVYARRDGKAATADDEGRWPWAVFLLEVR